MEVDYWGEGTACPSLGHLHIQIRSCENYLHSLTYLKALIINDYLQYTYTMFVYT